MTGSVDYSKAIIYKLCCRDPLITDIYINSTTNLRSRKHYHKTTCNKENSNKYNLFVYQFIRNNGGWNNWDMVMVEKYKASDRYDLYKRERYWVEELKATLNQNNDVSFLENYYKKNVEQDRKRMEENKRDKRNKQKKIYREKHKEEINQKARENYQ